MAIAPGIRLDHFTLGALLGAGGMGTVYRAYDARLQRYVAIKVLAPGLSGDAERLRRFEQEALVVARLTHPNIVSVHDVGRFEDSPYIVTELLEGQTLRHAMDGRPLPVRKAIEYARQVAHGLAAAHERGIVHRDIKPENLFVTREDRIKILDFGIAKLTGFEGGSGGDSQTLTGHGLGPVGTAAYMSPEQARGDRTDARSDLFSLGVVLYEMVTGVSPFRRETAAETMTAILREEPPELTEAAPATPGLGRLLEHCLEKSPASRFQSARDLLFALDSLSGPAPVVTPRLRMLPRALVQALAVGGGAALIAAIAFALGRGASDASRDLISTVHRLTEFVGLEEFPAMSPDSKAVAFTARVGGVEQIFVRLIAGGTPLQVTKDNADHALPRWSPDSSSLVYFSPAARGDLQGTLWEIPALGGAPRRIIGSIGGGDVGPHGRIAAFRLADKHVELLSAAGDGSDARVMARFAEPVYFKYPRWSPDSRWIAYQRGDGVRWDIFAVRVDDGNPRQLTHDNGQIHGLAWLPDSSGVVYSSGRGSTMPYLPTLGLWEQLLARGEPRRLAGADVSYLQPDIRGTTSVASRMQVEFDLWRFPFEGSAAENVQRAVRLTRQTGQVQTPTVGPADREIAFLSDSGGHANLWITSPSTGELRQLTYEREPAVAMGVPIWSPDGGAIAFVSSRGNTGLGFGVWLVNADGGNVRNVASRGLGVAWSPDSQWIYYSEGGVEYKVRVAGDAPPVRVRPGPVRNVIGFHGATMYFMVDRTLTDGSPGFEIHAAPSEDAPSRVLASISPSRAPQWQIVHPALSPDGAWLAMPLTDGVTTNIWGLSTSTGEWKQITDFGDRPTFIARRVSWSRDGRSIVAAVGEADADIVMFERR
jgi:Tol biopolymer transport system component